MWWLISEPSLQPLVNGWQEILSGENKRQLWIPEGFAHGFLVLSETAEFLYKTTEYYAPEFEKCIIWNDSDLDIKWPIEKEPILSSKDKEGKILRNLRLNSSSTYQKNSRS